MSQSEKLLLEDFAKFCAANGCIWSDGLPHWIKLYNEWLKQNENKKS